jgi:probable F420-dependent oxidoreductase
LAPSLTLQLPSGAAYGGRLTHDWPRLLDLARLVEGVGADRLVVVDHVVMGGNATEQYVWSARAFPPADSDFLEPLVSLAAIATATSTLRLSTRILIAPLRPAALLAKSVATLDVISGGRVELGVGTGWQREEYDAEGLDWARRGQLLTDTIAACRALWERQPCSFTSETVELTNVTCAPLPVQPRLPVWFGGTLTPRNLARIIDLGDGWIPIMTANPDDVRFGAERLRLAAAAAGRPAPEVQLPAPVIRGSDAMPDLARTIAGVADAAAQGATDVFFSIAEMCPDLTQLETVVTELASRFRSEVS